MAAAAWKGGGEALVNAVVATDGGCRVLMLLYGVCLSLLLSLSEEE